MTSTQKKIFVLDTNVILHDSSCIHQFGEHDVVIPITVLVTLLVISFRSFVNDLYLSKLSSRSIFCLSSPFSRIWLYFVYLFLISSILVLSNFIPTIYFGMFTGLAMLLAMISVLTLLPSLIIMVKPFGK